MRRASTWLVMEALALLILLWSPSAHAGEEGDGDPSGDGDDDGDDGPNGDEQGRPFGRLTKTAQFGLGFGYSRDLSSLTWGVGAGFFVIDGLELGLSVSGTHLFWSRENKNRYPGIDTKLPGALIEITGQLRYVFFRNRWVSPYIFAGTGPTILTNKKANTPTLAHWATGLGAFIGLGPRVFLDLGMRFSGQFPGDKCRDAFTGLFETEEGAVRLELSGICRFQWSPRLSVGVQF